MQWAFVWKVSTLLSSGWLYKLTNFLMFLYMLLQVNSWLVCYFQYQFISEILRWRAQSTADHVIFTLLNCKGAVATMLSCSQLHKKAERVGNLLLEKGKINTGDHVALIFPPGIDLICAFYGCLYVGKYGHQCSLNRWSVFNRPE